MAMRVLIAIALTGLTARGTNGTEDLVVGSEETLYQCWLDKDVLLEQSPGLNAYLPRDTEGESGISYRTTELPDGSGLRVARLSISIDSQARRRGEAHTLEILVARPTDGLEESLTNLRMLLLLTWITSSLGCAAILSWVVRRGLNPLGLLRREIRSLDEGSLDQRVALSNAPEELEPVVEQLNDLLSRLQGAFAREHAFTAHAAHELRTPLAGLRSTLELTLARPRTVEAHRDAAESCFKITLQMQSMVEDLLALAKLAAPEPRKQEEVDFIPIFEECRSPYDALATERGLDWSLQFDMDLRLNVDPNLMQRVLHNLIDNAVSYSDRGSTIRVTAKIDEEFKLRVSNRATGVPEEVTTHAFDPLWRADPSRTETGSHTGLGLSLTKRIIEIFDGEISAEYDGTTFAIILSFPQPE